MTDRAAVNGELLAADRPGCFRIRGELGFGNARRLWEQARRSLPFSGELELDLSGVARTDSAGVALLMAWTRETRHAGGSLRFVNIPAQIHAIATACGVQSILPLDGDGSDSENGSTS